jgi:predicted RNA binding protein YcfA (HicA-like mRNA interferase family)
LSLRNHYSREVIKVLKKHFGFYIDRQKGSHIMLKHPDGRYTVVPWYTDKPIKEGTMGSIISQAQISKEEFLKHF